MYKRLIDAISIQLYELYGISGEIEQQEQNFEVPCFYIEPLTVVRVSEINKVQGRNYTFNIRYHQAENEPLINLNFMGDSLIDDMELLDLKGDLIHGSKMSYKIIDGVLHFFINYNVFLEEDGVIVEKMEEMDREEEVHFNG